MVIQCRRKTKKFAHLSAGVGDTNIAARVTLLRKLTGEEIVQLGAENTVSDKLALLADLAGHLDEGIGLTKRTSE